MSYDLNKIIDGVVKEVLSTESVKNAAKGIAKEKDGTNTSKNNCTKKREVTLAIAKKLVSEVEKKAEEMGVKAVCSVCDKGGNTVVTERMDDGFIASVDIAVNKAYTSVSLKMPTKDLAELACPGGSLYGIQHTNGGRIVIFGGGVPLLGENGEVIGGFGVSGGTAKEDTFLGDYAKSVFENMPE